MKCEALTHKIIGCGYEGTFHIGQLFSRRRVDFFVEEFVMVEIKALIKLEEVHLAQAMNYCPVNNYTT